MRLFNLVYSLSFIGFGLYATINKNHYQMGFMGILLLVGIISLLSILVENSKKD